MSNAKGAGSHDEAGSQLTNKNFGNTIDSKSNKMLGPLYSSDNYGFTSKENMGPVSGPKGGKVAPDPLGYCKSRGKKR